MAAYIVKVMIENTHPPVWRRIAVPEKILYKDLHAILQIAFGWYDYHLHDFTFPGSDFRVVMSKEDMTFGDCVLEGSRLIDEDITEEKWIRYTYDFGDDWAHKITFEKMDYDYTQRYATILKWKGDNFSEDVGGVYGAEYFMTDEAKEEYGEDYMEPRQPFDLSKTNDLLARKTIPVRKNKGKASSGKRSIDLSNPAIKKEMQQFLRELMKAAMEETGFEVPEEQYLKPKKPSKNETMVNKWLDFSDRWAAALQSAGVPSKSAESQTQAFMEMQEQLSKEGRPCRCRCKCLP